MSKLNSAPSGRPYPSDLDTPVLEFAKGEFIRLRDLFEGMLVFGGVGSGKSSGVARTLAHVMLANNFGGMVLCAKPGEADTWEQYAREMGREESILRVGPTDLWRMNFVAYELRKSGNRSIGNIVELIFKMVEATRLSKPLGSGSGSENGFWEDASRQLLLHSIPIIFAANGTFSFELLRAFMSSAPKTPQEVEEPTWQATSVFHHCFRKAREAPLEPIDSHTLSTCATYWLSDFAPLDNKTRSNIVISLTSMLSRFSQGRLHTLFCTETTFVPELTFDGTILLLDMPEKIWKEDGVIAQIILKYLWQRAAEARAAYLTPEDMRPLFLAGDECQFFLTPGDAEFFSTARSARVASLYITQSLPTIYSKIGGIRPEHTAEMLLANLCTRIFCRNVCHVTNRWAAESAGQGLVWRESKNWGSNSGGSKSDTTGSNIGRSWSVNQTHMFGPAGGNRSATNAGSDNDGWNRSLQNGTSWGEQQGGGLQQQKDYKLDPAIFTTSLRSGGPEHGGLVDAVWMQAGRRFSYSGGDIFTPVTFKQEGAQ
ncbi:hypothetical protein KHC28_01470 [Ancylobacter sonchi]|uniref:TraM recognition domain-containing protein n=1 Tax=Ancylobacter sonchi TaxID=1937790 RepID=UPI001BD534F8|nr:hypothetical protein [Ancylobacter sonchi]MBS7532322.1 hypothetical protein [Ancylobacter sonchi]